VHSTHVSRRLVSLFTIWREVQVAGSTVTSSTWSERISRTGESTLESKCTNR
jgi:ABC-type Na+ efflux pump permease subunit